MPRVMIKCPTTGKMVPTGFSMDRHSFETATLIDNGAQCSACHQMHIWSKKDAKLEKPN